MGDRARESQAYCNLRNDYHSLSNFQEAIEYHKKDLAIAKEVAIGSEKEWFIAISETFTKASVTSKKL